MIEAIEAARDRQYRPGILRQFVRGVVQGQIPDYQVAAWLMAVYLNGLDEEAVFELARAMAEEGTTPPTIRGRVDKHSTGGVGDKTTLILAPLVASLGIPVLKMSGRGLGHTGGTLDKLESIPGFQVTLDEAALSRQMDRVGVAVVAQSANLAPADGVFYAIRDVTGTVGSLPLIAASIMSKKLALGAPNLVLDVKVGSGALMKTLERARSLAELMIRIGESAGLRTAAVLTNMDEPLGQAVGNAVEVMEAWDCLTGRGPADLREEVLALASQMVSLAQAEPLEVARNQVENALDSGRARDKWMSWLEAQGGDPEQVVRGLSLFPASPVFLYQSGTIEAIDTEAIGRAAQHLGAGRLRKEDPVDPRVGVRWLVRLGDTVDTARPIAEVLAPAGSRREEAVALLQSAVTLGPAPTRPPAVLDILPHA